MTATLELVIGEKPYRHCLAQLREDKRTLEGIKIEIERITGHFSPLWSMLGKQKADLRQLVDTEIVVVGNMADTMNTMATHYGGEREALLDYFDSLSERLTTIRAYKPVEIVVPAPTDDKLVLLQSLRAHMDKQFHDAMQRRLATRERNTEQYAQESVHLLNQCQSSQILFLDVAQSLYDEHEHLKATGPAQVSSIERAETGKLVAKAMAEVRTNSNTMYATVHTGYKQVRELVDCGRAPFIGVISRKIELLRG